MLSSRKRLQKNRIVVGASTAFVNIAMKLAMFMLAILPAQYRLIGIGTAFWRSRALHAAALLDIASVLGDDSWGVDRVAARVGADTERLYRLLRFLAALGIFEETSPREFRNNKTSRYLRADESANVRAMILMHNGEIMSRPWYEHFDASVVAGDVPFERCHRKEFFRFMNDDRAFDATFANAMDSAEGLMGTHYATDLDWSPFDTVFDLGGSKGAKMITLLERHAHLKAVVVDRPGIIECAQSHWRSRGKEHLLPRVRFEGADILMSVPEAKSDRDVYFLSAVLHGMDDGECLQLLRNVSDATQHKHATVVLLEAILPEAGAPLPSALADIQLMMATRGRLRTLREWKHLFQSVGLALDEVVRARPAFDLLVLRTAKTT